MKPRDITFGKIKLLLVLACFILPLALATIWYAGFDGAHAGKGRANHAPLITPPVPLNQVAQTDLNGRRLDLPNPQKRWTLIHPLGETCDAACEKRLRDMRQTRLALGRDARRLQRLILSPNKTLLQTLARQHPHAQLAQPAPALSQQLRKIGGARGDALLVDPLGNIMLRVPATLAPRLVLKDLKRLLKLSRIG